MAVRCKEESHETNVNRRRVTNHARAISLGIHTMVAAPGAPLQNARNRPRKFHWYYHKRESAGGLGGRCLCSRLQGFLSIARLSLFSTQLESPLWTLCAACNALPKHRVTSAQPYWDNPAAS